MLEMRPVCENCRKPLPNESEEAMICTYECTFCKDCVINLIHDVCPTCGGNFCQRPNRPAAKLKKHSASTQVVFKPVK